MWSSAVRAMCDVMCNFTYLSYIVISCNSTVFVRSLYTSLAR